jgi:protein SCO1/2
MMRASGFAPHSLILASLLAVTLAVTVSCTSAPDTGTGTASPAAPEVLLPDGGPIPLLDHEGEPFSLERHLGEVVVVFFGYTLCPDYCPTAMAQMSRVVARLGPDQDRVVTVFISVDPERDTPQILKAYVGNFRLRAVGLTGSPDAIDDVVRRYGATYEIVDSGSAMGPQVHHSTQLALVEPEGRLRRLIAHDADADTIARAIAELL